MARTAGDPVFEVVRFRARLVTPQAALLELEGRFATGVDVRRVRLVAEAAGGGARPAVLAPLGDPAGLPGEPWRATFAVPAELAEGHFGLDVGRRLLLELPAPDAEDAAEAVAGDVVRLGRTVNDLRRRLDDARAAIADADARASRADALEHERAEAIARADAAEAQVQRERHDALARSQESVDALERERAAHAAARDEADAALERKREANESRLAEARTALEREREAAEDARRRERAGSEAALQHEREELETALEQERAQFGAALQHERAGFEATLDQQRAEHEVALERERAAAAATHADTESRGAETRALREELAVLRDERDTARAEAREARRAPDHARAETQGNASPAGAPGDAHVPDPTPDADTHDDRIRPHGAGDPPDGEPTVRRAVPARATDDAAAGRPARATPDTAEHELRPAAYATRPVPPPPEPPEPPSYDPMTTGTLEALGLDGDGDTGTGSTDPVTPVRQTPARPSPTRGEPAPTRQLRTHPPGEIADPAAVGARHIEPGETSAGGPSPRLVAVAILALVLLVLLVLVLGLRPV